MFAGVGVLRAEGRLLNFHHPLQGRDRFGALAHGLIGIADRMQGGDQVGGLRAVLALHDVERFLLKPKRVFELALAHRDRSLGVEKVGMGLGATESSARQHHFGVRVPAACGLELSQPLAVGEHAAPGRTQRERIVTATTRHEVRAVVQLGGARKVAEPCLAVGQFERRRCDDAVVRGGLCGLQERLAVGP